MQLLKFQRIFHLSIETLVPSALFPIIMVQWENHPFNERKLILEIHPFLTSRIKTGCKVMDFIEMCAYICCITLFSKWWICRCSVSGIFRDPQKWEPFMVSFPYYSHTTPIRIPKDMGIVPFLGVPENTLNSVLYNMYRVVYIRTYVCGLERNSTYPCNHSFWLICSLPPSKAVGVSQNRICVIDYVSFKTLGCVCS